jgi:hypothetical protein
MFSRAFASFGHGRHREIWHTLGFGGLLPGRGAATRFSFRSLPDSPVVSAFPYERNILINPCGM